MNSLQLGNLVVEPGQIGKGSLGSVEMADGTAVQVPVMIARGVESGPTFVVTASVHGNEVSCVWSLIEVFKSIDPGHMKGTLIGVMVANPLVFQIGAYVTPYDNLNLSGPHFSPTQPDGRQTHRLAAAVNEALEIADMVVDMHANPLPSMPFTIKDILSNYKDEETAAKTQKMAEAFGFTIIEMPYKANQPASIRATSTANGIPALTPELAGNIYIEESVCRPGTIGLLNIMKAFDMITGEIESQTIEVLNGHFRFAGRLRANRGGLMVVKKRPGELVAKDETVIDIVNIYGDVVEEIKMPREGYCWSFTGGIGGTHAISEGDNLAYFFVELTGVDDPEEAASKWF